VLKVAFFTAVESDLIPLTEAVKRIRSEMGQVIEVQARSRRDLEGAAQWAQFKEFATRAEEAKHVFRARLLNPKWLQSMRRHGYKGAADISRAVDIAFGWDATAEVLEDWMYEQLARKYALDEEMQEWLKEVNPYALQNITERLLEAIERGMWETTPQMKEDLLNVYLDVEGEVEESQEKSKERLGI
jgi:cobalamin biosynthesis Mg chelatase CobN